jgi:hypothetical protein
LISLQSLSQPQAASWNSTPFRSIAQMIRAFLFATATIVWLTPRRSRSVTCRKFRILAVNDDCCRETLA